MFSREQGQIRGWLVWDSWVDFTLSKQDIPTVNAGSKQENVWYFNKTHLKFKCLYDIYKRGPKCGNLHLFIRKGSDGKESACNAGDPGSITGWEDSPGEGNGNPLQYSCLGNPMDREAWRTLVYRVTHSEKSQTWLSMQACHKKTTLVIKDGMWPC